MQLFYNADIQATDSFFTFDKEESKHIVKVLRKTEGDIIHITNGLGNLFVSEISIASDKKCEIKINEVQSFEKPKYNLHLAVAPTKMNDRLEWFLEKATEIGIQEITPIICDHSERKVYKIDRAEKIIQSAMKQSNQFFLPKINEPVSFKEFVQKTEAQHKFIAHCVETERKSLKNCVVPAQDYVILIGPEGDFSENEITLALSNKYQAVLLGNTRLRTETAALVACHTVALLNE